MGSPLEDHAARLRKRPGEVALCLDFDGTLSPIVDDPQAARLLQGIVELHRPWPTNSPPPPSSRAARPPT